MTDHVEHTHDDDCPACLRRRQVAEMIAAFIDFVSGVVGIDETDRIVALEMVAANTALRNYMAPAPVVRSYVHTLAHVYRVGIGARNTHLEQRWEFADGRPIPNTAEEAEEMGIQIVKSGDQGPTLN
jgi:hypothetical protein